MGKGTIDVENIVYEAGEIIWVGNGFRYRIGFLFKHQAHGTIPPS